MIVTEVHPCLCFRCPYNIIDLMATIPTAFIIILIQLKADYLSDTTLFYTVLVMAGLGVFRVLRLFKFIRHYDGVRVLFLALKVSYLIFWTNYFHYSSNFRYPLCEADETVVETSETTNIIVP